MMTTPTTPSGDSARAPALSAVPAPGAPHAARPPVSGAVPAPGAPRPTVSLELFPPRPDRHATQTWGALDRLLAARPDFASVTYRPSFIVADPDGSRPTRRDRDEPGAVPAPGAPHAVRPPVSGAVPAPGAPHAARPPVSGAVPAPGAPHAARPPIHVNRGHNPAEDVITHVATHSDVPLMTHLTCIGYRKDNVIEIVHRFLDMGVRRFLALRGDPPPGLVADDVVGDLPHADDLVRVIREVEAEYFDDGARHIQIAVAAYPADIDHGTGIEVLSAKQAAGADLAITQVFYDPDDYLALRRAALYSGVTMPILPGIIPLTDLRRLTRLEALTGVAVPPDLARTLGRADGPAAAAAGIDATLNLASAVLDGGAPGVHLYTFNRVRPALDVISHLRLGGILTGSTPDTAVQREVRRDYLNATPGGDRGPSGRMPGATRP